MSANLGLDQLTTGQTNKETTVNAALGQADQKLTAIVEIDCSTAGQAPTLLQMQRNLVVRFKNVTGAYTVAMPTFTGAIVLEAAAANTHAVTVTRGTTTIDIAAGKSIPFYFDGSANFMQAYGGASANPLPTGGTAGQALTKASGTDFDVHWATIASGGGSSFDGGTPAAPSHKVWRLQHCYSAGGGAVSISELQMRTTAGVSGSAVAPASSSASSAYAGIPGGYDDTHAYDADTSTFWSSTGSDSNTYIQYNFATAQAIAQLYIDGRHDSNFGQNIKYFDLYAGELTDGSDLKLIGSYNTGATSSGNENYLLAVAQQTTAKPNWMRLAITTNNYTDNYIEMAEIAYSVGGVVKTPIAIRVSADYDAGSLNKYNLIDGSTSDRWANNNTLPVTIDFVFDKGYQFDKVTITPDSTPHSSPKDFKVQYSTDDGATFTDIVTFNADLAGYTTAVGRDFTIPSWAGSGSGSGGGGGGGTTEGAAAAYWRLLFLSGSSGTVAGTKMVFKDSTGTVIATTGGTVIKSSEYGGYPASRLFDGSNTPWYSNVSVGGEYVGYQFTADVNPATIEWTPSSDAPGSYVWRAAMLQSSTDGVKWKDRCTFSGGVDSAWAPGVAKVFTVG